MKSFLAVLLVAVSALPLAARANEITLNASASLSTVVATVVTLEGSTDISVECPYRHRNRCNEVYKMAAVEAAQFMNGAQPGPI